MKPQRILGGMLLAVLAMLVGPAGAQPAGAIGKGRPNVLFVLIDDMGYADLSCYGGERAKTKEIDRLASEGLRFTRYYVNSPICSPSRVAVTTGQYPNRWGITSYLDKREVDKRRGVKDWLAPEAPSLARFLQAAGYHTAHVGKWHMGGQRDVADAPQITRYGFDTSVTNFEGLGERFLPKFDVVNGKKINHVPTNMSAEFGGPGVKWVDRWKVSEAFVDRAIKEMDAAVAAGKPFYINLWPDDVHTPCQAAPGMRGDGSQPQQYVAVLNELDRQLGRAFEHIRSTPQLRDNTIVLVASDNGPEMGVGSAGELRGNKGQLYEGGFREPLIAWWPGGMERGAVGTTNDVTVMAGMDLPPSILSLVGVAAPAGVKFDGQDMSAAIAGRAKPRREGVVMWVRPPDRPGPAKSWPDLAIREGDWKLLINRDGSKPELFDVMKDPNETKNLAKEKPELAERLGKQVIAWDAGIR